MKESAPRFGPACRRESTHGQAQLISAGGGAPVRLFALFLLVTAILPAAHCSRKKDPGASGDKALREASARYAGEYRLEPSVDPTRVILHADGTATMWAGEARHRGAFQATSQTLRIFITPEAKGAERLAPIGVFLVADYNPGGWRGLWDGDAAFLIRGEAPPADPPLPRPSTQAPGP